MELYVTSKEIKNAPSRGGVSLCSIVLEDTNIVLEDIIIVWRTPGRRVEVKISDGWVACARLDISLMATSPRSLVSSELTGML